MKITRRLKWFCYITLNVCWFIQSAIRFIERVPSRGEMDRYLRGSLIMYFASAGCMNFLLGLAFRDRTKNDGETGATQSVPAKRPNR